jgi:HK97 family phage major capsid protein
MKKSFIEFLSAKSISKDEFAKKSANEQGELHSQFLSENFEEVSKLIEKNNLAIDELAKKSKGMNDDEKAEVVRLANELKALKETSKEPKAEYKSVGQQVAEQLKAQADALEVLKDRKGESLKLSIKAAGTMSTGNVTAVGTNGLSMLLNQFESGISPLPRTNPFFAELFSAVPTSGNTISYAEMKNPDGGAGMTGEGSAKTQADFDLVEAKTNVRKITSYIKTSKEALDDIPALAGEINNELLTLVSLKKDSQLLSGDGTGNNLSGVLTVAQTFTGGSLAGTIATPNNYDVLVAGITEIMKAEVISGEPAGFMPNYIVLNPSDIATMKLTKDLNGNYIFPVSMPNATSVMDVTVVSNPRMTAGSFLIMDSTKGNLRIREDVNISIGYENDDFTKNLITILAEMRLAFYVKSNHVKAFLTGTFSNAISLLTA